MSMPLIYGTCDYVRLLADSTDVIKVANASPSEEGDDLGLSVWAQYNHKGPYKCKREREKPESEKKIQQWKQGRSEAV